jgi:predicted enzyme related to lactoylglutathione lyase
LTAHLLKEDRIMSHGSFAWNELRTNDVEGAKAFYGTTIGWTFEEMPMPEGSYWIAKQDDEPVAGLMDTAALPEGTPPHWFAYLEVDDIDERIKEVAENEGSVLREPFDIPGVGRIAILADSTGAVVGWMTTAAAEDEDEGEDEEEDEDSEE